MSIQNALNTGVSGLKANATKVGTISDNIANSNTVGYKRAFADMVTVTSRAAGGAVYPAAVAAQTGNEISRQGSAFATSSGTDLSIAGGGFFVVAKTPNETDESEFMLTRAGGFTPDESGYLRNAAGYYLHGFEYDPNGSLGVVDRSSFDDMTAINVRDINMQARATTQMSGSGNLPAQATGLATPGDPFISTAEYFSPLGDKDRLILEWQPTGTSDTWDLTVTGEDGTPYGSMTVEFHDSGPYAGAPEAYTGITNSATAPASFGFNTTTGEINLTINNGATPQNLNILIGAPDTYSGMTQFAGDYTPASMRKDGSPTGSLVRTEITDDGEVQGVFDNGLRQSLFQIPLGVVTNPNGLHTNDGNAYNISGESGTFSILDPGSGDAGLIRAGSLEQSNVEISDELTDLIQTQRAYSTNAKIITAADEMLEETTRLKR